MLSKSAVIDITLSSRKARVEVSEPARIETGLVSFGSSGRALVGNERDGGSWGVFKPQGILAHETRRTSRRADRWLPYLPHKPLGDGDQGGEEENDLHQPFPCVQHHILQAERGPFNLARRYPGKYSWCVLGAGEPHRGYESQPCETPYLRDATGCRAYFERCR